MSHDRGVGDLPARLGALARVVVLAEGRLEPALLDDARAVLARSGERARHSTTHTVVTLGGSTGSGKSSLFNVLTGLDLAAVGSRRPTTSAALACVWGVDGATALLDWLRLPAKQRVSHESELDAGSSGDLHGLVLVDLPDHDSTREANRCEVDRLVGVADLQVWVTDPQKYADAAMHDRYLRQLGGYEAVTVVLNQVDRLPADRVETCVADLRRLVERDGLTGARVIPVSARDGRGVDELRAVLTEQVARRRAAHERLAADVGAVASRLAAAIGPSSAAPSSAAPSSTAPSSTAGLGDRPLQGLWEAAGVEAVASAVAAAVTRQGVRATGWLPAVWLSGRAEEHVADMTAARVRRSEVDVVVRGTVDRLVDGLQPRWANAARARVEDGARGLADGMDEALAALDLGTGEGPRSWRVLRAVQWAFLTLVLVGLGLPWVLELARGASATTTVAMVVLGVAGGVGAAAYGRGVVRRDAEQVRDRVASAMREAVTDAARKHLLEPGDDERVLLLQTREALAAAQPG